MRVRGRPCSTASSRRKGGNGFVARYGQLAGVGGMLPRGSSGPKATRLPPRAAAPNVAKGARGARA